VSANTLNVVQLSGRLSSNAHFYAGMVAMKFLSQFDEIKLMCRGRAAGGQCYDHYFGRFSPILGKKLACFLKTNFVIIFYCLNQQYFV
jgi:hypothetical protein